MTRTVLDLFSGLGGFSAAFADSDDWEVVTVDIEERFNPDIQADVMNLRPGDLPNADVVLASPPCTEFSLAQNMNGGHDPSPEAIVLIYHTIGLVKATSPDYWFLENPYGKLRTVIGPPTGEITYCQYGEHHQKPTDLWGDHPPMTYRRCARGSPCHDNCRDGNGMGRAGKRDPAERAKVPYELSESIREAVKDAYQNPPPEQVTLAAVGGERA